MLIATLTVSLISTLIMHNSSTWWNKYSSYYNQEVATIINQSDKPLVLGNVSRIIRTTSLSHHLKPETKFMFFDDQTSINIPSNYSDVYVFRPLANLVKGLESQNYQVTPIHQKGKLWQVQGITNN
jgi:N-glycosylase/DNA lyase